MNYVNAVKNSDSVGKWKNLSVRIVLIVISHLQSDSITANNLIFKN